MHRLCSACTFVYCLRELRCLKFQNQCRNHYRFLVIVLLTQFHKHRLQGNHYNKVLHVPLSKSHLHNQLEGSRHENVETSNSFCHCCRELHNLNLQNVTRIQILSFCNVAFVEHQETSVIIPECLYKNTFKTEEAKINRIHPRSCEVCYGRGTLLSIYRQSNYTFELLKAKIKKY